MQRRGVHIHSNTPCSIIQFSKREIVDRLIHCMELSLLEYGSTKELNEARQSPDPLIPYPSPAALEAAFSKFADQEGMLAQEWRWCGAVLPS